MQRREKINGHTALCIGPPFPLTRKCTPSYLCIACTKHRLEATARTGRRHRLAPRLMGRLVPTSRWLEAARYQRPSARPGRSCFGRSDFLYLTLRGRYSSRLRARHARLRSSTLNNPDVPSIGKSRTPPMRRAVPSSRWSGPSGQHPPPSPRHPADETSGPELPMERADSGIGDFRRAPVRIPRLEAPLAQKPLHVLIGSPLTIYRKGGLVTRFPGRSGRSHLAAVASVVLPRRRQNPPRAPDASRTPSTG